MTQPQSQPNPIQGSESADQARESSELSTSNQSHKPATLKDWLSLLRIANLPSAWANVLMGFLFVNAAWTPVPLLLCLLAASTCLYLSGMVLNDVCDVEQDKQHNRNRPIAAGKITLSAARTVAWGLLILGPVFGFLVDLQSQEPGLRATIVAVLIAVFVVLYDAVLKRTPVAPLLMGSCRTLNVLLGASVIPASLDPASFSFGWPMSVWWIALSIGVLIVGVTWFARNEAETSKRSQLIPAGLVLFAGITGIAFLSLAPGSFPKFPDPLAQFFPFLILLISITIIRRTLIAIATCDPSSVQSAVISSLRSLIFFDAAVCLLLMPNKPFYALIVLALLLPSLWLSKWFRQT